MTPTYVYHEVLTSWSNNMVMLQLHCLPIFVVLFVQSWSKPGIQKIIHGEVVRKNTRWVLVDISHTWHNFALPFIFYSPSRFTQMITPSALEELFNSCKVGSRHNKNFGTWVSGINHSWCSPSLAQEGSLRIQSRHSALLLPRKRDMAWKSFVHHWANRKFGPAPTHPKFWNQKNGQRFNAVGSTEHQNRSAIPIMIWLMRSVFSSFVLHMGCLKHVEYPNS